jgi:Macrocin-O-methyltransferase (TylF)
MKVNSRDFGTFTDFLDHIIEQETLPHIDVFGYVAKNAIDGLVLEFGVAEGLSVNEINNKFNGKRTIYGFDSFEGLPEDWQPRFPQGSFKCSLPRVPSNVILSVGLFQDTVPWWSKSTPGDIAFIHLDADLYSSTAYVFEQLENRLVEGSIILFDELYAFGYDNYKEHEYKAFVEHHERTSFHYSFLGCRDIDRRQKEAYSFMRL